MTFVKIKDDTWDFVDTRGEETHRPLESGVAVELPKEWRIFGPFRAVNIGWPGVQEKVEVAALREIKSIPDSLVAGQECKHGQNVSFAGDMLDFGKHFGGHALGQHAYALAELELDEDMDLTFGAGADYWMQWWIDGELVYDTSKVGNRVEPSSRTDHSFSRHFSAGTHLLAVRLISGSGSWVLKAGVLRGKEALAVFNSSDRWKFVTELKEIHPPAREGGMCTMAINVDRCLADETIECEFQKIDHTGNFGIVFGAQDSGHYYYAQVPWHGQLPRARGVWAAISKTDGSGYVRNLSLQLMTNVPAYVKGDWLTLKVQRSGNTIQMWVNGVKGPSVTDMTYGPGRAGLAGFSLYRVRNLRINGRAADGKPWPGGDQRGKPWFHLSPDPSLGDIQSSTGLCKMNDEIVAAINVGRDASVQGTNAKWTSYFYSSPDHGRTWNRRDDSKEGGRTFNPAEGAIFPGFPLQVAPGTMRAWLWSKEAETIAYRDSTDKAASWSESKPCTRTGDWHKFWESHDWYGLNWVEKLKNGNLLAILHCGHRGTHKTIKDKTWMTWPGFHTESWATLSPDMGLSWSPPVPTDHAAGLPDESGAHPNIDMIEPTVAQLPTGRIVLLARPCASPFMWQTHSDDGGQTWSMACYAPFTGHGYANLVCTTSGYLVVVKRGPGLALNISVDRGVNWDQGTMIDYAGSFNGRMVEVEPDVVLMIYPEAGDEVRPSYVRTQLIRITPDGPVPLPRA
jgi:hypothetical protein